MAYRDTNGVNRPAWWNSSDEDLWGHITENRFKKILDSFERTLRARRMISGLTHRTFVSVFPLLINKLPK